MDFESDCYKDRSEEMDFELEYYKNQNYELLRQGKFDQLTISGLETEKAELTKRINEQEDFIKSVKNIQAFIGLSEELKARLTKGSLDE